VQNESGKHGINSIELILTGSKILDEKCSLMTYDWSVDLIEI